MSKPIVIEKAKNFFLVVLFLSTVLLLYFFWGNISFDNLKQTAIPAADEESPKTPYLIKPDRIIVNFGFGRDNYIVIQAGQGDVWYNGKKTDSDDMVKELNLFGQAENVFTREITYDKYQEVMKYRSIWAEFNYDIPTTDFFLNFGIKKPQGLDSIETITAIGYSPASEELKKSIFIKDGKNGKYYWLSADKNKTKFGALIDTIESEGYNTYYPISTYLGVKNNNTLVPLILESSMRKFPFEQEIYSYQSEKINEMAEPYFGGNFDFVRRIKEDKGTWIYMYGYGQIVLILNTDGSIEYKEEQTGENSGQSFMDALNTAIRFVADHGSWGSLDGATLTPYLKDVVLDPNKEDGYQFIFGLELNENRLYYEQGDPITVNVTKGQVTYYKRDMIDFEKKELDATKKDAKMETCSSVDLITQNCQYIYNIIFQAGVVDATVDQNAMFEEVASSVNNMQIGYVKLTGEKAGALQPAWIVTIDNIYVYFNLYTAEPMGYTIK